MQILVDFPSKYGYTLKIERQQKLTLHSLYNRETLYPNGNPVVYYNIL